MAETNVLDPSLILHSITQIVPNTLQSPYDALAAATHAVMLSVGFRYAGLGDDARQVEGDGTTRVLPEAWNAQGPHSYSCRYSHPQSSLTFVIKSLKLGERWIVHGLAIEDNKTASLDISAPDYTSASFFPYEQSAEKPLVHGFISTERFNDFILLFKINILQKLIPGLYKPGYQEEPSGVRTTSTSNEPSQGTSPEVPRRPEAPSTRPPIFDEPFAPEDPFSRRYNPLSVGWTDLDPLSGQSHMPGGDGMYVGPEHPMFGEGDTDPSSIYGGPEPIPRQSVPPGARFDPIGPFGRIPGRGGHNVRGRGGFGGRGGRGGPGSQGGFFSGEPDNDEFLPPGNNYNMYM
ncbi:hypothetical protein EC973_003602 [Apophysomyces ossiformis]|uniref:Proteasome inhibitor PI31 subunit n=1 Tax=Apophysomyces ossiformis TaxID=679940 RepID=A0A8H7BXA3_9FUNG|nr:hypothetical protein EC973_003602 [Apophysomyces ossiformis]